MGKAHRRAKMKDQLISGQQSLGHMNREEKKDYLRVLSDVVWDIEAELAVAKAERAAVMSSLQTDVRREAS
jgi:hypothetical protein